MAEFTTTGSVRESIVDAAERLLREQGAAALTTRAVAHAAGVQAPTIYRHFGDKEGLIGAVAERVMATHVAAKRRQVSTEGTAEDPVSGLRDAWKMHMEFGLANPELYELLNAPGRRRHPPAAAAGIEVLRARVRRLAAAGLLRVDEERAVLMIHAAGSGALLALLAAPPVERDVGLTDAMLEAVLGEILASPRPGPTSTASTAAVTLKAVLPDLPALTDAERAMMAEWLTRSLRQLS